jgi:hypothetical protein
MGDLKNVVRNGQWFAMDNKSIAKMFALKHHVFGQKIPITNVDECFNYPTDARNIAYVAKTYCKGTSSTNPLVNVYKCINNDVITFRFGTKISCDSHASFDKFTHERSGIALINAINTTGKKAICISLLSPCNGLICNDFFKTPITKIASRTKIAYMEPDVLNYEIQNSNENTMFISLPLSDSGKLKNLIKLYNYDKFRKDVKKTSTAKDAFGNPIQTKIYDMINLDSNDSTFRSIVEITRYYVLDLSRDYVLMYHCKSGKDRTSIFDAIVQSTIYHMKHNNQIDYEAIRALSQRYLIFGLFIAYHGTGFVGLKLNSIPVARYILDDLYDFYKGHADHANSSV